MAAWFQSRNFHFDDTGRPLVYLSFRREGVHRSYRPGLDPVTGQPKVPVTLDRIAWFTELARQSVVELDPARFSPWFDPNSGSPNLWYFQTASNRWRFYNRPHFHGQSQVQAKPITQRPRTAIGLPLNAKGETPLGTLFMAPFRLVGGAVAGMAKAMEKEQD